METDFLIILMPEKINIRVLPFWSVFSANASECREDGQVNPTAAASN